LHPKCHCHCGHKKCWSECMVGILPSHMYSTSCSLHINPFLLHPHIWCCGRLTRTSPGFNILLFLQVLCTVQVLYGTANNTSKTQPETTLNYSITTIPPSPLSYFGICICISHTLHVSHIFTVQYTLWNMSRRFPLFTLILIHCVHPYLPKSSNYFRLLY